VPGGKASRVHDGCARWLRAVRSAPTNFVVEAIAETGIATQALDDVALAVLREVVLREVEGDRHLPRELGSGRLVTDLTEDTREMRWVNADLVSEGAQADFALGEETGEFCHEGSLISAARHA
jgi:hypothetical protein